MSTQYSPGDQPPMTAKKFAVAVAYAVVIAVLNLVVSVTNANPAWQVWGSIALALLASITVYAVPNKIK